MSDFDISKEIQSITSREKMIRYLDEYSTERMEESDKGKIKRPWVKSYLLEHIGDSERQRKVIELLADFKIEAQEIDQNLYRILDKRTNEDYIGFLEVLSPRYFVFYTIYSSDKTDKWVKNLVLNSPDLDHVWLSGLTFDVLWKRIAQITNPDKYISISFFHKSIYKIKSEICGDVNDDEEYKEISSSLNGEDDIEVIEGRVSEFKLIDKISVVKEKLNKFQELYLPFYAISQLRFPSPIGRGGYDFYNNGKVINRSENFRDHRSHILYIQRIYDELIKMTEEKAWYSMYKETSTLSGQFQKLIGSPVTIKFGEPLSKETFDYWIKSTFSRMNNCFRLWGNPIVLGPTKVHVYGVDKHLWRPIYMEITDKHLVVIIPKGTCGNTIHRLVCNILRYIDPSAKAYIGDIEYKDMVEQSILRTLKIS